MPEPAVHEHRPAPAPQAGGSERGFGLLIATVLTVVGCWPLLNNNTPRWWSLALAAVALVVALAAPRWLAPAARVWLRFGLLLHHVTSPIILAVIYFGVVTPTGLLRRALGKDPLGLKRDPDAESYWIVRKPPGPDRESMSNQF